LPIVEIDPDSPSIIYMMQVCISEYEETPKCLKTLSHFSNNPEIIVINADTVNYQTKMKLFNVRRISMIPTAIILTDEKQKMYEHVIILQQNSKHTP
jgi:hypothetical protein